MFLYSLSSRVFYSALALAASAVLNPFDASAPTPAIHNRWDVLHFNAIAHSGYLWEHQYAFFPTIALLIRHPYILTLLSIAAAFDAAQTLYNLSLLHLRNRHDLARLAALLSLIPFSPPTLYLAPYTEPFFTWLSYRGMLASAHSQWVAATLFFTLASTFRSNGFLLAGFILWGIFFPYLQQRRLPSLSHFFTAIASTAAILSPFVAHNLSAYYTFCYSNSPPHWCEKSLPLIYTHVQATYWNSGLFKYWSLSQLPNFLIAIPPLFALFSFSLRYLANVYKSTDPFFDPSILPHAIHALLMALILLFASHTQIALRLAPSMPFTYWAAAYIITHPKIHPYASRVWLPWALIWSSISVILWVAFLPPA